MAERDLADLLEFTRRSPRFQPLLLATPGDRGAQAVADRAGIRWQGWDEFLLAGPPPPGP